MRDGLALQDHAGRVVEWNKAASAITGWSIDEAGVHLATGLPDGLVELGEGQWVDVRHFDVSRRGRPFRATLFSDARHQVALREAYARLNHLVTTDALTGLSNRVLATDRLRLSVTLAQRDARPIAVLFVDLDRFKLVNDTLGHPAGDELLRQVADRLREATRASDTVARIGGDEFVVVLHAIANADDAEKVAKAVLDSMAASFHLAGHEVRLGASVGIAVYPEHGTTDETLVSHADLAMYRAKAEGGSTYRMYGPLMSQQSRKRLLLAGDLRRALDRRELVVHYQPQIDVDSGLVVGAEALVRWQHPHRGLVPPGWFLDVAEDDGSIVEIDRRVLRTACEQTRRWDDEGFHLPVIAVNLSARTMQQADVARIVAEVLASSRLPAARLQLEVGQHLVAAENPVTSHKLTALKQLGVRLAIDDFDGSNSFLARADDLPIDAIKLRRSFVTVVTSTPRPADLASLRAVIARAAELDLRCVAGGVETVAQQRLLKFLQCHLVQGFLYSGALDAADFTRWLAAPMVTAVAQADG